MCTYEFLFSNLNSIMSPTLYQICFLLLYLAKTYMCTYEFLFSNLNSIMSPTLYQICFLLLYLAKTVIAKECRYIYENGDIKYFHCSVYEYCCGTMCCRTPAMTFYQMWYFWLMVFLTILFCSGGGWWYKIRNHEGFLTNSNAPRVMPPQLASYYGPARGQGYTQASTYPQQAAVYPQTAPLSPNSQYPPPPPYYGPPPSYDTVVNQGRQG